MVNRALLLTGDFGLVDGALVRVLREYKNHFSRIYGFPQKSIFAPVIELADVRYALTQLISIERCVESVDKIEAHQVAFLGHSSGDDYLRLTTIPDDDPIPDECRLEEVLADRPNPCVLVTGCFDLIHPGHMRLIEQAAAFGAHPVVAGLSTPAIRCQPKNACRQRPVWTMIDRFTVFSELRSQPRVCFFPGPDCLELIDRLRPDIFVKEIRDRGRPIVDQEVRLVESLGGRVEWVDGGEFRMSTTSIVELLATKRLNLPKLED